MPHQGNDRDRRGDLVFIVVVVAAYISIFTAPTESFTLPEVVVLIALGMVYSIIGTYGFASCERAGSLSAAAVYGPAGEGGGEPKEVMLYDLDLSSKKIVSGIVLVEEGELLAWDKPGESVWISIFSPGRAEVKSVSLPR